MNCKTSVTILLTLLVVQIGSTHYKTRGTNDARL